MLNKLSPIAKTWGFWVALCLVVAAASAIIDWPGDWRSRFWVWSGSTENGAEETNSTTLRNVGFIVAGLMALLFAYWRSAVADRQAKAAEKQAETTQIQADTAQRSLLNERYQKGAEMLGSNVLTVRLGGIYAHDQLAKEDPEQYHVQIMKLFCGFLRPSISIAPDDLSDNPGLMVGTDYLRPEMREDHLAVRQVIASRSDEDVALERKLGYRLDLSWVNLRNMIYFNGNLQNINFASASLSRSALQGSSFDSTVFFDLDLSGTLFSFEGKDPSKGLTQGQLDMARAFEGDPPILTNVLDAETGKQLVWNGGIVQPHQS